MEFLRKYWLRFFKYSWKFGLLLILLFGIPRFILVLQSNVEGGYGKVFIIFLVMWFAPFILLTKQGRRNIGIKRPSKYIHLLYSFLIGVAACTLIFVLFKVLYASTLSNAFAYISRVGISAANISNSDRLIYFIIAVIPSMIFSPIGEEFLYRGVIHGSFVSKFGESKASIFDSLAFALTHLAHFGIVYTGEAWTFLLLPSLLWVGAMFAVSQLFFRCKVMSQSIFGAVLSHSGYNFAMMYFIFYHLF